MLRPADLAASWESMSPTATTALSVLGAALAVTAAHRLLFAKKTPPGAHALPRAPDAHWLLGDLPALLRNKSRLNEWLLDTTRACGERPWLQTAPLVPDMMIVATPAIVEDITRTQHGAFGKGDFTHDVLEDLLGEAFFAADGPAWFHQRKTATKFFSARMYREVAAPIFNAHAARALAKLEKARDEGTLLNLTALINAFALQSFSEIAFGLNIDQVDPAPLDHALEESQEYIFGRVQKPVWLWKLQRWLNVGDERKYRETVTFLRNFVSGVVSGSLEKIATQSREEDAPASSIIELFIDAMRKGEDHEFSPELLCDLALMFVLASRDTSADTFNWFFYNLSKHPEVEERIREEMRAKVPEFMDGTSSEMTVEQAHSLVYLEAVIKETLRLFPPVIFSARQALSDAVLCDGTFVPKGTNIGISMFTLGRLASVWGPDAGEFKPDRFLDQATGKLAPVSPFKFYGFGSGPRNCIGMNLAMLEMKMLILAVVGRFRLEMEPNDGSYKFSATYTIASPLVARVTAAKQ